MIGELFWTALGIVVAGPILLKIWQFAKQGLTMLDPYEPPRVAKWEPSEAEWTTARLRRARTERYRAEHAAWDKEFNPHAADQCPVCSGRRDRTRRSAAL